MDDFLDIMGLYKDHYPNWKDNTLKEIELG
jgi:hypothetical protein